MKKYNQNFFSNKNLLITITSIILAITACSEVEKEQKLDKQPEVNEGKIKPVVTTSKPKTTKAVSELDTISTAEQNSEIKIIPNHFPYDEKEKKKGKDNKKD